MPSAAIPLAIIRAGVRYPDHGALLRDLGVPPVPRDRHAIELFPDDDYDLTPTGFADLDAGPAGPRPVVGRRQGPRDHCPPPRQAMPPDPGSDSTVAQAVGVVGQASTALGSLPAARSATVVCSSTARRLARTATHMRCEGFQVVRVVELIGPDAAHVGQRAFDGPDDVGHVDLVGRAGPASSRPRRPAGCRRCPSA